MHAQGETPTQVVAYVQAGVELLFGYHKVVLVARQLPCRSLLHVHACTLHSLRIHPRTSVPHDGPRPSSPQTFRPVVYSMPRRVMMAVCSLPTVATADVTSSSMSGCSD